MTTNTRYYTTRVSLWILLGVILLTLLLPVNPVLGASATCQVKVNAPAKVKTGADFSATLDISVVSSLDAADFKVSFDPTVLRLDKINNGLVGGIPIPVDIYNENYPGIFTVVLNIADLEGATGSGYLASLGFRVIGKSGQTSQVTISELTLADTQALEIPSTCSAATIKVESSGGNTGGGGGSGGGGADSTTTNVSLKGWTGSSQPKVNSQGQVQGAAQLKTGDGRARLDITTGTKMLTSAKQPLSSLTSEELQSPPDPGAQHRLIRAYSLGPEGSQFDPPLTLTISYAGTEWAESGEEANLDIFGYNGSRWESLGGTIDPTAKTVSAGISHFSSYALMAEIDVAATPTPVITETSPAAGASPSATPETEKQTPAATVSTTAGPVESTAAAPAGETTTAATAAESSTPAGEIAAGEGGGTAAIIWITAGGLAVVLVVLIVVLKSRRKVK